jgi:anti-sigma B factor antagonist
MSDERSGAHSTPSAALSSEGGRTVLVLTGELDISTVGALEPTLVELGNQAPQHLIVDLTGVTFMDSSGIALLLEIAELVPGTQLRNPSPLIRQVIEMTGLTDALPTADDR